MAAEESDIREDTVLSTDATITPSARCSGSQHRLVGMKTLPAHVTATSVIKGFLKFSLRAHEIALLPAFQRHYWESPSQQLLHPLAC